MFGELHQREACRRLPVTHRVSNWWRCFQMGTRLIRSSSARAPQVRVRDERSTNGPGEHNSTNFRTPGGGFASVLVRFERPLQDHQQT